jgi:PilZ domain
MTECRSCLFGLVPSDQPGSKSFLNASCSFVRTNIAMERRENSRYFVNLEIEIKEDGGTFPLMAGTADVSLGGCYVATIFPLVEGAQIHFSLRVADNSIKGCGLVQTCHPSLGMGIRFTDLVGRDKLFLEEYLRASPVISSESASESYLR